MAYNPYQNPYYQPFANPYMMQQPIMQPAQQPMQQAIQQPQQQVMPTTSQSNIIWVKGMDEVNRFPVAPGNTVIFMDNDNPVAYQKSADMSGRVLPLEVYDLVKRDDTPVKQEENHQISLDEYLTKKEFEAYRKDVERRFSDMEYEDTLIDEDSKPVRRGRKRDA